MKVKNFRLNFKDPQKSYEFVKKVEKKRKKCDHYNFFEHFLCFYDYILRFTEIDNDDDVLYLASITNDYFEQFITNIYSKDEHISWIDEIDSDYEYVFVAPYGYPKKMYFFDRDEEGYLYTKNK